MTAITCPTSKLEKLLLSTDGSEFSEGAVREAIGLAKTCKSKLFAVSVVETNTEFEALAPDLVEKAEKETRALLESIKEKAKKEGVDCETIAHEGEEPYRFVVEEAAKRQAEMIIMGRRGRTGLKRLMMGSVTAKVIGHAPCKVLVVPKAAKVEYKNILIATDGSKYSEAAVREAIGIAKKCGSKVAAVCVATSDAVADLAKKNVDKVAALGKAEGVAVEAILGTGVPYETIIETAKKRGADLIVVGTHGRKAIERLLMGKVAERVVGHADCAVLVVKA
jgi:nucleotide-binding universal stress UspA family protein